MSAVAERGTEHKGALSIRSRENRVWVSSPTRAHERRREVTEFADKLNENLPSALKERIAELEADNKGLRTLLILRHGCGFDALYGDDGELQCHKCGIDFKRMPAEEISERFEAIGRANYTAAEEP